MGRGQQSLISDNDMNNWLQINPLMKTTKQSRIYIKIS